MKHVFAQLWRFPLVTLPVKDSVSLGIVALTPPCSNNQRAVPTHWDATSFTRAPSPGPRPIATARATRPQTAIPEEAGYRERVQQGKMSLIPYKSKMVVPGTLGHTSVNPGSTQANKCVMEFSKMRRSSLFILFPTAQPRPDKSHPSWSWSCVVLLQ